MDSGEHATGELIARRHQLPACQEVAVLHSRNCAFSLRHCLRTESARTIAAADLSLFRLGDSANHDLRLLRRQQDPDAAGLLGGRRCPTNLACRKLAWRETHATRDASATCLRRDGSSLEPRGSDEKVYGVRHYLRSSL